MTSTQTKIIICEDDDLLRQMYRTVFSHSGFDVRAFANAEDIVEKAHAFQPAIIITDILMPKIDGYEATRRLKRDQRTSAIPIAAISNLADPVSQQKITYYGAIDFIVKANLDPHGLIDRVNEILAGKVEPITVDPKMIAVFKLEEQALG